jgi:hypothetical protein
MPVLAVYSAGALAVILDAGKKECSGDICSTTRPKIQRARNDTNKFLTHMYFIIITTQTIYSSNHTQIVYKITHKHATASLVPLALVAIPLPPLIHEINLKIVVHIDIT